MEQLVPNITNLADLRPAYKARHEAFLEKDLTSLDPMEQFGAWFNQIRKTPEIPEPNAMCISTVNKDGAPSSRYVLLKSFSSEGFKFFTNCSSRKGKELEENQKVALNFYWAPFNRQVRVEGIAERVHDSEAETYFHSRPFDSQVSSAASHQSETVPSRDFLIQKTEELRSKYVEKQTVPKPPEWGGYLIIPHVIEFWQGQSDRLHDRIVFKRTSPDVQPHSESHPAIPGWTYERLSP